MHRRALSTFVVVALLVLAGCTSGGQPTTTATATDETTTATDGRPATTTTTGPTVESVSPPGITDGDVTNASAIVAAHERALRNRSFTSRYGQTVDTARATSETEGTIRYDGSGNYNESIAVEDTLSGNYTQTRWTSGFAKLGYGKTTLESGRVGYYRTVSTTYESTISAGLLGRLVEAYELRVTRAGTLDDTPVVVVQATGVENATILRQEWFLDGKPQNTSFRMVVDEDGLIRSYTHSVSTNETRIEVNQTFSGVGTTAVTKPGWIETAVRDTRQLSFTANETTGQLVLNFTAGEDIPSGTTMELDVNNTGDATEFTLNTTLEAGNVYYVAFEDGEPYLTTEKPPARELNGTSYVLGAIDEDGETIFRLLAETTG